MKLIEGLKFFDYAGEVHIKDCLVNYRKKHGDENFCKSMCGIFGARSFNQFLDYKLLAIKLSKISREKIEDFDSKNNEYLFHEIVGHLFFDDRHDMYQNIPYYINRLVELNLEQKDRIYSIFSQGLIDSFNVRGNEDFHSENMEIKE